MENVYRSEKVIEGIKYRLDIVHDDMAESPREQSDDLSTMVCFHSRYDLGDKHEYNAVSFLSELANEYNLLDTPKGEEIRRKIANKMFSGYTVEFNEDENGWDINTDEFYNNYSRELFNTKEEGRDFLVDEEEEYIESEAYGELSEELALELLNEDKNMVLLPLYLYDHGGITMNTTGFSCGWDSGQVGYIYTTIEKMKELTAYGCATDEEWRSKAIEILEADVEEYDQYLRGEVYGFHLCKIKECDMGCEHEDYVDSCFGFYGSDWKMNGIIDHVEKDLHQLFDELV